MNLAENISIEYKEFKSDRTFKDVVSLIEKEKKEEHSKFKFYLELKETEDVIIFGRITTFDEIDTDTGKLYREFSLNTSTVDKKSKILTNHVDNISLMSFDGLNNYPVWTLSELESIGIKTAGNKQNYEFQALRAIRE